MDKSAFIDCFIVGVALYLFYHFTKSDEERFWEGHQFENPLEKADDLCKVGYTFQRNGIIYKKISQKKWLAEILTPGDDQFEIGTELTVEKYIYKKNGEKSWTIEKNDLSIKWPVLR